MLFRSGLIGDEWIPPEVGYTHHQRDPSPECCESAVYATEGRGLSETDLPVGDFPHCWGINFGVLTRNSSEALRLLIGPHVEFLPLRSGDGDFTAFKVLRFVDALDVQHSIIDWEPKRFRDDAGPRLVRQIRKYVFHREQIENEVIFRIPQLPTGFKIFVTEVFLRAVDAHNLVGFQFQQIGRAHV